MQNWNQWPVPAGTVSASMPPPPTGYTAPGTDPMATMQAYMQYYNQPPPSGYTPEQWSAAQQQNWAQWQQWQQQYQQWQAQYGEKYQETMKQYGVTGQQAPPLPLTSQPPPPPPKDDKPPLPPTANMSSYGYSTGAPPPPPATSNIVSLKRASGSETEVDNAKKIKECDEELSEAEKTFDAQFKQWEEKFNTWKLQNANHPDKTQYKQYEAKWTSWREKLIERREQMRRKREQQKLAAAAKAEAEKKDMPGGDKILNILSSTENQGLINNLLGIGKTLGLTTKQDHTTITSTNAAVPMASAVSMQQQSMVPQQVAMTPMMQPDMSQAWAQWNQYNPAMNTSMPPMGQPMPTQMPQYNMQHIPMTAPPPHQIPPPNFSQPPPGFPPANFSQPPPGYSHPPPPLNTNPPPPPVSQPPININLQQLSKCPPPNILGTSFANNQQNSQRGLGKDNQFRQGSNEDSQGSNFNNRGNWNNRVNRNNFNQGNNQGTRNNYNQGNTNDFNKGNDDNDNKFGGTNKGGSFGRSSQENYNTDNNYENCNDDYNKFNFNNFGNKDNRFINRQQNNNQQQSEDNMSPELKKLMAKRKAVTDVFKPSSANFGMDTSCNVNSLSESFKKVSGDKGFGKGVNFRDEKFGPKFRGGSGFDPPDDFSGATRGKFGQDVRGPNDFGNDGSNNYGNRGSNNFGNRGSNDFGNTSSNSFGTRGAHNFVNLNDFGNRGSNNFVNKGLGNYGNFGNRGPNSDFENIQSSSSQDQIELSKQVSPESSNYNDQIIMFGNNDNVDISKDQSKILSLSDKPLDFEDSNNQILSGNKFDQNKGPLDNFNNISGQKEFSYVENKESNDLLQNKNNSGLKENSKISYDLVPSSLKNEAEIIAENIIELESSNQSPNINEQKLENVENKQQLDTTASEKQSDSGNEKNVQIVETNVSPVDFIEPKDLNNQASTDIVESSEPINSKIDESIWMTCNNESESIGKTISVEISAENDRISNQNDELNEISTNQDVKESDFSTDIQQQKSDTLPFMGAEDPKAEDMNIQPPPEQPNVAMITTLEEPPTPSFTDEISEEAGSMRNRGQSFDFQTSFNSSRLDDAPMVSPNQAVDPFDKSGGFGILTRRGMNEDFRNSGPDFCVGKQFNYNHGEMLQDNSLDFLAPAKVIDYSHETRVGVYEFVEPVGIFDYGHGKLKPSIPDIIQDFQNWEDSEHNLHEYHEEMRKRSEKFGKMWTSPTRSIDKSMWDEYKLLLKDRKERYDCRDSEKDRDDRRRDKDRDERRDRDRDERLNDRLRDKDRNRDKERDDRYSDRNRIDKEREDRYRDSDRYGDRYRFSDRDRGRSRDKDRDDRYKDREDRYKDREDRYKDREDRYKERNYDKDRDDRYKDRGYEKDRDDRHKDRVDKDPKDKNTERDIKNKISDRDAKDKSFEKELKDKCSEKDTKDRNLEKDLMFKYFDKDSKENILEKDCEDINSEKDKDLRAKRDKLPEQKEDEMVVEKSSSPEKNKEQEERGNKSKDLEKNDDRSKENSSWQDSIAIISTDTTSLQDNSLSEIKQNVLEIPPKIMELPKTPNLTMVDDILCTPGRLTRPPKIAIILRGPPGSGKSFVAKLIKDKEIAQGGSAPRILSIDDYFLVEKDLKPSEDNKKDGVDEMEYKYEEAMEPEYVNHLFKAFKKNITDGFFNFIILDSINEKISDYEEMWSFAKTKGFKVYVCEMEMDVQICLKRNIHKRSEDEINRIVDYFEPAPSHHHKLDVTSLLQEQAIEDVEMEDVQEILKEEVIEKEIENEKENDTEKESEVIPSNDESQDSQEDAEETGVSKWEKMEAEDKLDRLDGLKRKHDNRPQTIEEFLQVPDYYDTEDSSGKKHVRWADLEERKEQEKLRAVGFVVGQTNWNRMMDPTHGSSALTRTKSPEVIP